MITEIIKVVDTLSEAKDVGREASREKEGLQEENAEKQGGFNKANKPCDGR